MMMVRIIGRRGPAYDESNIVKIVVRMMLAKIVGRGGSITEVAYSVKIVERMMMVQMNGGGGLDHESVVTHGNGCVEDDGGE